ncbi:hypothetical protein T09_3624 [Trichinella sp. T9]|nr:hypothetical protein T09_1303 [Trichinella sp. T9]KRX68378.1 hypothetical protein T09_3624 [Trichinella sp. T9]
MGWSRPVSFFTYWSLTALYFFMISISENNFYHCSLFYFTKVTFTKCYSNNSEEPIQKITNSTNNNSERH